MDSIIQFEIPTNLDFDVLNIASNNYTDLLNGLQKQLQDSTMISGNNSTNSYLDNYGMITVTVWIIVVLIFFLATIIFCICSCLFYNKIRRWNRNEMLRRQQENIEANLQEKFLDDLLPSYTLVSGLPSYDAAIEQFTKTKSGLNVSQSSTAKTTNERPTIFQIFRYDNEKSEICSENLSGNNCSKVINSILPSYEEIEIQKNAIVNSSSSSGNNSSNNDICRNDKLSKFLIRLQSQISTDSTISNINEKEKINDQKFNK